MRNTGLLTALTLVFTLATNPAATDEGEGRALSATGDAGRGRIVFYKCKACHLTKAGATPLKGPNLEGLFGRTVGGSVNFPGYSAALEDADFVWTEGRLDQWLLSPNGFLPGNNMTFAGLGKARDRADLLAYLRKFNSKL